MRKIFFLFILVWTFSAAETAFSQTAPVLNSRASSANNQEDDLARDLLKKQRIKAEEKAFRNILERCDENSKLSVQVQESFAQAQKFMAEDIEKLDRITRNSRKILNWLNAEPVNETDFDAPKDTAEALAQISEISKGLRGKMSKNTRFSISLSIIEEVSNLLRLTGFARQGGAK